jgi:hypothetical protein
MSEVKPLWTIALFASGIDNNAMERNLNVSSRRRMADSLASPRQADLRHITFQ